MALLIMFEVKNEETRQTLVDAIAHYGNCIKLTASCFAVKTDQPAGSVYDGLQLHLGPNEVLLVLPIERPYMGGDARIKQWLDENLPA
jgi:hypothetical protein